MSIASSSRAGVAVEGVAAVVLLRAPFFFGGIVALGATGRLKTEKLDKTPIGFSKNVWSVRYRYNCVS